MKIKLLLHCCILIIYFGCKSYKTKYPYSLDDFRPELREHLEKLLSEGIICKNDSAALDYLKWEASVSDLKKILKSENPILRAFAFRQLVYRDEADSGKLLITHLDDTSKIWWCDHYGENFDFVSDYFIKISKDHTNIDQRELFELILEKHNKLLYVSKFASRIKDSSGKYYNQIRSILSKEQDESILKTRQLSIKLSEYRNEVDTNLLFKQIDLNYSPETGILIIDNFPHPKFFQKILKFFSPLTKSYKNNIESTLYYMLEAHKDNYYNIVNLIPKFKTLESKNLLEFILKERLYNGHIKTHEEFCSEIYTHLIENRCEIYENLIGNLKPMFDMHEKKRIKLPPLDVVNIDTPNPNYW